MVFWSGLGDPIIFQSPINVFTYNFLGQIQVNAYYDYYFTPCEFFTLALAEDLSLSDSKSPQVFRTFLSILADLNNAVLWMSSIRPLISNSFCFLYSLAMSMYLSFFSFSLISTQWFSRKAPDIGLAVRVLANGPGDLGSIPGRVIPKTQKMVLDASLLNTQHYKVRIKGKVE